MEDIQFIPLYLLLLIVSCDKNFRFEIFAITPLSEFINHGTHCY
jgi:hypothetical protein